MKSRLIKSLIIALLMTIHEYPFGFLIKLNSTFINFVIMKRAQLIQCKRVFLMRKNELLSLPKQCQILLELRINYHFNVKATVTLIKTTHKKHLLYLL